MLTSGWITATIANGAKVTSEIDLGNHYNKVLIIMSALTTSTVANVQVSNTSGGTFVNLHNLHLTTPADVAIPASKAAVVDIAGARFLILSVANDQGEARTIYLIGVPW